MATVGSTEMLVGPCPAVRIALGRGEVPNADLDGEPMAQRHQNVTGVTLAFERSAE